MDFGNVALAGAFLKPKDFSTEKKYPLMLCFCESCYAVQVGDKIDPDILFKEYFYHSSAIGRLKKHFTDLADKIAGFNPALVVEIGCNDGVLLRPLSDRVGRVIGVDPSSAARDVERVINDYFTQDVAQGIVTACGHADVIVACNVFAHIPDINGVTEAIKYALSDDGVFIFEVHSLDKMIEGGQYDWVYHEHLYYYSLLALENHFSRHGMKIFDVEPTGLHAGSRRYYVCKNQRQVSDSVIEIRKKEIEIGLHRLETFRSFAERASAHKGDLMLLLNSIRESGKKVVGYGACGRANTMIQYCGITRSHMDYIVDDAPVKHGHYTPGSHFEIKPNDKIRADYLLIFAWSFWDDIAEKCDGYRGKFIIPLPNVHIKEIR
jgi:SAM-dependent methyltransferase